MAAVESEIMDNRCAGSGLDSERLRVIAAIQNGLPLVSRPYAAIAKQLGLDEAEVIAVIDALVREGYIKRYGIVVNHRGLGYCANAMVVWDFPDSQLDGSAGMMQQFPFITLCYSRPRKPPRWRYNLFCMIHGQDRNTVLRQVGAMITACRWQDIPHAVLFSRRQFKQRGARYYQLPTTGK